MTDNNDRAAFLAAHDVSRETLARLDIIIETLDQWRTRSNLIGPKEWPQIWTRHVGDSVQLLDRIPDTARVVDLGSGAGFPGLILAAARPAGHVTMIESVGKKCAFLRAAIKAADLPAEVHQGRSRQRPRSPLLTSLRGLLLRSLSSSIMPRPGCAKGQQGSSRRASAGKKN